MKTLTTADITPGFRFRLNDSPCIHTVRTVDTEFRCTVSMTHPHALELPAVAEDVRNIVRAINAGEAKKVRRLY